ncbi:GNAT family N-acetyltransferase [Enterococcus canis]|uniref:GNAT family N-acetyltransferase n=1 Tax=Enterococcus canis TaxID=214095 RepID=UPI000836B7CC|nr:GNAT family protein [Enterococcus canis]
MSEVEITLREAIPSDAAELAVVFAQLAEETPYLVTDPAVMQLSEEALAMNLAGLYETTNNILLLALADNKIVGTASVRGSDERRVAHIGEVGISVLQDYWGLGLGTILLEELIFWAEESEQIRRLELTVQSRNARAIHLYEKMGFQKEGVMIRGAWDDDGTFLDVDMMALMIDPKA